MQITTDKKGLHMQSFFYVGGYVDYEPDPSATANEMRRFLNLP